MPSTGDIAMQGSVNNTCDAILMARALIGSPEVMKFDARNSLQLALTSELRIDREEQQICIGNPRGLDILKELTSLQKRLTTERQSRDVQITSLLQQLATERQSRDEQIISLLQQLATERQSRHEQIISLRQQLATEKLAREEQLATEKQSRDQQITSLQSKITSDVETNCSRDATISSHDAWIRTLISGNESYRSIRNRYISTFKRDVLREVSDKDKAIIDSGNQNAHGGDVEVDASLYNIPEERSDHEVFQQLYGLFPKTVLYYISGSSYRFHSFKM